MPWFCRDVSQVPHCGRIRKGLFHWSFAENRGVTRRNSSKSLRTSVALPQLPPARRRVMALCSLSGCCLVFQDLSTVICVSRNMLGRKAAEPLFLTVLRPIVLTVLAVSS